jgi:hypothetical protein
MSELKSESMVKTIEVCQNPWKYNPKCCNTNIKLYIQTIKKKRNGNEVTNLPICEDCWAKISKSNKEWGSDPNTVLKPIMIKGNINEKELVIMDTKIIGHPKKGAEPEPSEEDDVY